ncbi:hypothetical protein JCM3775_005629 [Rhodotorula graminis]|uniref:F-box domain-containing protein n=1 Tax=Rhodotorula graminis (strain WP1) TaxID=578459 RepID=A0A194SAU2_RHOGW|nr:uncharacterized protein RHOBADRAFT_51527 [Rhodotorula graminis WP1]KPV77709.1 hypothetical protein RHOBADRAFT_51527 [Rhodotorula graminis WP1]
MSDKLNDDVLLAVLEHIAEPAFDQRGYRTRQSTLLSLCLASRHLYRLVEPLLWRQVRFKSVEQLAQLRRRVAAGSPSGLTSVYTVPWQARTEHDEAVLTVADILPNIVHIELSGTYRSILPLASHSNLRRLSLWQVYLSNSSPTLPQLEQLAIRDSSAPKYLLERWLDPFHLPRLRALLFCGVRDQGTFLSLEVVVLPPILAQLEVIQTDDRSLGAHDPLAWSDEPPCLCYHGLTSEVVVRYNLYGPTSIDTPSMTRSTRRRIDAGVRREQLRERRPSVFVFPAAGVDQMARLDVPQLEEQGLCVLFDEGDSHEPQSRELVSHEFWWLARALKAERERREDEEHE